MKSKSGLKSDFELILIYVVLFVLFASFATTSVIAMNHVIRYYTERETNVIAADIQIDLDAEVGEADCGLEDPEIRHLLEIYANLHDLDIAITDRQGVVQVSSVRDLTVGEPLFAGENLFSPTEPYLMRNGTLHFIDGAWISERRLLKVTYCTTRPVIGTDSRMVILARNSKLMDELNRYIRIFVAYLFALFVVTLFLMTSIQFGYRRRIIQLATVDELTGISNRKAFTLRYSEQIRRGHFEGGILFMLDVDKFKQVNDTYGHSVGDQALAFVSQRIQSLMNQNCIAGRWGGDEFIGVYTNGRISATDKLNMLLEEIREMPVILENGEEIHVTVSIGAVPVDTSQNLDKNVERADAALYHSKKKGRDCITIGDIDSAKDG